MHPCKPPPYRKSRGRIAWLPRVISSAALSSSWSLRPLPHDRRLPKPPWCPLLRHSNTQKHQTTAWQILKNLPVSCENQSPQTFPLLLVLLATSGQLYNLADGQLQCDQVKVTKLRKRGVEIVLMLTAPGFTAELNLTWHNALQHSAIIVPFIDIYGPKTKTTGSPTQSLLKLVWKKPRSRKFFFHIWKSAKDQAQSLAPALVAKTKWK